MSSKREQILEITEDAARGETKTTLRARIAELEAEVDRLLELFKTQSDAHAKHVQGLLAQHATERDIYGKVAQDFRERAEKAEALSRTGAVKVKVKVKVKALEWRGSETERMIAFAEFGGAYGISVYAGMPEPFKVETYGWWSGEPCGYYTTLDAAKAAAQADYERRILSGIASHQRATNTVDAHETAKAAMEAGHD